MDTSPGEYKYLIIRMNMDGALENKEGPIHIRIRVYARKMSETIRAVCTHNERRFSCKGYACQPITLAQSIDETLVVHGNTLEC